MDYVLFIIYIQIHNFMCTYIVHNLYMLPHSGLKMEKIVQVNNVVARLTFFEKKYFSKLFSKQC